MQKTKFLLDSGDPEEYRKVSITAKEHGEELWGGTTNPSLIAKKLTGQKITQDEAFKHQKELVLQILDIVPGAVSAEVYADASTTPKQMIQQGREIATWNQRMYVKLPTTIEGMKARTVLRKEGIAINNTLVFSLQQILAISLHEKLVVKEFQLKDTMWPCFISPFVGRLDDRGENGMMLIEQGVKLQKAYGFSPWILESSVRNNVHVKYGIELETDIMTAPLKVYEEWFSLSEEKRSAISVEDFFINLKPIPFWTPDEQFLNIGTVEELLQVIEKGELDISHPLTTSGIEKFASDWKAIIV